MIANIDFTQNVGVLDRWVRIILAEITFIGGFFWLGSWHTWVVVAVAIALLVTVLMKFCPLYATLSLTTARGTLGKRGAAIMLSIALLVLLGGIPASHYATKQLFITRYDAMNAYYKLALFNSGQGLRDATAENYAKLVVRYDAFERSYTAYRPYALVRDTALADDLARAGTIIHNAGAAVDADDLAAAHTTLEGVRPILTNILKRNGLLPLATALADFHERMEGIITAADAHDASAVLAAVPGADARLQAVEARYDAADVHELRTTFETLRQAAQHGNPDVLPADAAAVRSAFTKVYLAKG